MKAIEKKTPAGIFKTNQDNLTYFPGKSPIKIKTNLATQKQKRRSHTI